VAPGELRGGKYEEAFLLTIGQPHGQMLVNATGLQALTAERLSMGDGYWSTIRANLSGGPDMTVTMPFKAPSDIDVDGVASRIDEVRRSLSTEAEHLAEMAAQYGREAGMHTANVAHEIARDPQGTANGWLQLLFKALAGLSAAFATSGRKFAEDAGGNAQSLARDLRHVRITTEPKKAGPNAAASVTLLAGFGAGMALMYFFDPERGRARREMVRERVRSLMSRPQTEDEEDQTQLWSTTEPAEYSNGHSPAQAIEGQPLEVQPTGTI